MITTKPVNIDLAVEIDKDEVIANVIFSNNSASIIYLDSWTIGMYKTLTNSIFSIRDENGKHVLYSGGMTNRRIVPEDFITLNPGESIQTKITLNKDYKLEHGHKYSIMFCAYNPTFPDMQPRLELLSNKVEITY